MSHALEPEDIRALDHFIVRVERRKKTLTLFLIITSAALTLLAYAMYAVNLPSDSVLGTTVVETQLETNPAIEYCLENGGLVINTSNLHICQFDDSSCPLTQYYATGTCALPSPSPSPNPPQPTLALRQYVYRVDLVHDKKIYPIESSLADYLIQALDLSRQGIQLGNIYYDTRFPSPYETDKFNHTYYVLLTVNTPIQDTKVEDYATSITLERLADDLILYLRDPDFCSIDDDCAIRTNFCQYGSFNHFQIFTDMYACAGYTDELGQNRFIYDESKNCKASTYYEGASCVNSSCIPVSVYANCQ